LFLFFAFGEELQMRELTYNEAALEAIAEEMRSDPKIFYMSTDALPPLLKEFGPQRVRATPITEAAAMAKLFATETAAMAVDVAIQVHGARALVRGHLLEHLYREVRGIRIYEGASEVQREIIARQLFRSAGRGS